MRARFVVPILVVALGGGVASGAARAPSDDDWPQWRGPNRDAVSAATGLLEEWSEGGPPLLWHSSGAGIGFASLSIVGGRIFTMGDHGDRQYVIAFDRNGGGELWRAEVGPAWVDSYGGPRSTPTVDGDALYALGTHGDLVSLRVADGAELWRLNVENDFGGRMMPHRSGGNWMRAESPLIDGDRVVVTPGAPDAMLVALDKATGAEIWRSAVPAFGELGSDGSGYSSIVVSEGGGVRQYVQLVGRGVIGVEAATGRFLWGYNRIANDVANIPTPLVHGDYVVSATGYSAGAALLRLVPEGDGIAAQEVWFHQGADLQNHHGGMVLQDGVLFLGHGHNRGFPMAVDLESGEPFWGPVRNAGQGSAAVVLADGHLYFRYQSGIMMLVEATTEEYREKGSFPIPDAAEFSWSHPVIVDGLLYLRELDKLYCYDVRSPTDS